MRDDVCMINGREYGPQHDDNHHGGKDEPSGCQRLGAGIVSNVRCQKNECDRQNGKCDRHCWRTCFRGHDLLEFGLDRLAGTLSETVRFMDTGYFVAALRDASGNCPRWASYSRVCCLRMFLMRESALVQILRYAVAGTDS